jgi:hypothetical protein
MGDHRTRLRNGRDAPMQRAAFDLPMKVSRNGNAAPIAGYATRSAM